MNSLILLPFENLLAGQFKARYKRFFADIQMSDGSVITAHCANSGSMRSCLDLGCNAHISDSKNPERKLPFSLELLQLTDGLACLNTQRANQLVHKWLSSDMASEFLGQPCTIQPEAKYDAHTRFDFCAHGDGSKHWIEVKSVSLRLSDDTIAFPDAETTRGQKHLQVLMQAAAQGDRASLIFAVMRGSDCAPDILFKQFRAAHEIDPKYAALLQEAMQSGVGIYVLVTHVSVNGLGVRGLFPYTNHRI